MSDKKLFKPHIYRICRGFNLLMWRCEGMGWIGEGFTPTQAYEIWKRRGA